MLSKKEKYRIALNEALEGILSIELNPVLCQKLLGFQINHVQNIIYVLRKFGIALDASDTGTGKTYGTVAVAVQEKLKLFIICPKAVLSSWFRVAQLLGAEIIGAVNYESAKNGKYYPDLTDFEAEARTICPYFEVVKADAHDSHGHLLLTPTGQVKKTIVDIKWKLPPGTLLVFDEAHKGKNGCTSSGIAGSGGGAEAGIGGTGNSKLVVFAKRAINREQRIYGILLSATITDKLDNFAVGGYMLDFYKPYNPKSYKQFLYNLSKDTTLAFKMLNRALFPFRGSRMKIAQIKEDTGDAIFKKNDVKAKVYKVSADIAMQIEAEHEKIKRAMEELRAKGLPMGLGYIIRCWQKIEVLKVPSVVDLIKNKLRKGMSVAVFINFNETKKLIYDRLFGPETVDEDLEKLVPLNDNEETPTDEKPKTSGRLITEDQVGFIHGGQDPEERDQVVSLFNEDKLHLVIANIKAGGVGISLHLGKRRKRGLHFPTWSAIDLKQALGRLYRANAENDVKQRIVYCSTGENKNLENPDASETELASMVNLDKDKEFNLNEVLSQIYQGKSKEEIDEEREKMVGELSQEESICHNVNRKLKNIELLNEGDLTGFQKVILVDDEK